MNTTAGLMIYIILRKYITSGAHDRSALYRLGRKASRIVILNGVKNPSERNAGFFTPTKNVGVQNDNARQFKPEPE
jgi:hypothetical protein